MNWAKSYIAIQVDPDDAGIPTVNANDATLNGIIGGVYVVFAAIALFYIVRAALKFVTSGSDPNAVKTAKNTIIYASAALVGSTVVFTVIGFVIRNIG